MKRQQERAHPGAKFGVREYRQLRKSRGLPVPGHTVIQGGRAGRMMTYECRGCGKPVHKLYKSEPVCHSCLLLYGRYNRHDNRLTLNDFLNFQEAGLKAEGLNQPLLGNTEILSLPPWMQAYLEQREEIRVQIGREVAERSLVNETQSYVRDADGEVLHDGP